MSVSFLIFVRTHVWMFKRINEDKILFYFLSFFLSKTLVIYYMTFFQFCRLSLVFVCRFCQVQFKKWFLNELTDEMQRPRKNVLDKILVWWHLNKLDYFNSDFLNFVSWNRSFQLEANYFKYFSTKLISLHC